MPNPLSLTLKKYNGKVYWHRLKAEFQSMEFHDEMGTVFTTSFTAGVATFPEDGETLEKLVAAADQKLLSQKRSR